ncbi:CoiA-like domain protein [Luteimonas deserti]|uniref:CoiA-like domain protein n=1 Tax=Luteimonas deserti TaxID=2752306 RepID=A0A7Z0QQC9_9GAMM|nr:CoiA-like domain protein [Luteimonas deserti]NYZ62011.1 CoiA-like domain protein [Luteimonas deserti]
MQYALINGVKSEAVAGADATCLDCGRKTVAKCGPIVMHHWAHAGRNCDSWWENETQWHRDWKNLFPPECREISHTAPSGEIHRADIKAPGGIYVEIQHSAMTQAERDSREQFYDNMIWIVDGTPFSSRFHLHHSLPDPSLDWAQDCAWFPARNPLQGAPFPEGMYQKRSLIAEDRARGAATGMHLMFFQRDEEQKFREAYTGHHQYLWKRPHSTWIEARKPVYLDFGSDILFRLETYPIGNLPSVRVITKRQLIHDLHEQNYAELVCLSPYDKN